MQEVQETWVQSLGWGDPLVNGMATHSTILANKIPATEEPGRLQSMGRQRVGHDRVMEHTYLKDQLSLSLLLLLLFQNFLFRKNF